MGQCEGYTVHPEQFTMIERIQEAWTFSADCWHGLEAETQPTRSSSSALSPRGKNGEKVASKPAAEF